MLYFIALLILVIGIVLLIFAFLQKKRLGVVTGKRLYQDTVNAPGEILYSSQLFLKGKPDFIMNMHGQMIPVEIKTGRTPVKPYLNHIMQVIAYCALVEENYHIRPKFGILKYPDREFKILYSDERKRMIQTLITDMLTHKKKNTEFNCSHEYHRS
jgi:CRISPR-associated exonuclease Cas4